MTGRRILSVKRRRVLRVKAVGWKNAGAGPFQGGCPFHVDGCPCNFSTKPIQWTVHLHNYNFHYTWFHLDTIREMERQREKDAGLKNMTPLGPDVVIDPKLVASIQRHLEANSALIVSPQFVEQMLRDCNMDIVSAIWKAKKDIFMGEQSLQISGRVAVPQEWIDARVYNTAVHRKEDARLEPYRDVVLASVRKLDEGMQDLAARDWDSDMFFQIVSGAFSHLHDKKKVAYEFLMQENMLREERAKEYHRLKEDPSKNALREAEIEIHLYEWEGDYRRNEEARKGGHPGHSADCAEAACIARDVRRKRYIERMKLDVLDCFQGEVPRGPMRERFERYRAMLQGLADGTNTVTSSAGSAASPYIVYDKLPVAGGVPKQKFTEVHATAQAGPSEPVEKNVDSGPATGAKKKKKNRGKKKKGKTTAAVDEATETVDTHEDETAEVFNDESPGKFYLELNAEASRFEELARENAALRGQDFHQRRFYPSAEMKTRFDAIVNENNEMRPFDPSAEMKKRFKAMINEDNMGIYNDIPNMSVADAEAIIEMCKQEKKRRGWGEMPDEEFKQVERNMAKSPPAPAKVNVEARRIENAKESNKGKARSVFDEVTEDVSADGEDEPDMNTASLLARCDHQMASNMEALKSLINYRKTSGQSFVETVGPKLAKARQEMQARMAAAESENVTIPLSATPEQLGFSTSNTLPDGMTFPTNSTIETFVGHAQEHITGRFADIGLGGEVKTMWDELREMKQRSRRR